MTADHIDATPIRALLAESIAAETEPCSLDHNGDCQEHGWFGGECWVARVRAALAEAEAPAPTNDGYGDCSSCGSSVNECEETDGGCCDSCRSTVGACHQGVTDDERDALAQLLSWTSGEFTRYREDAHPDHNRWSWQGDGHGPVVRNQFFEQADLILAAGWRRA